VIGAQTLHATGYAIGIQRDGGVLLPEQPVGDIRAAGAAARTNWQRDGPTGPQGGEEDNHESAGSGRIGKTTLTAN
jgi:hypothetical protein